MRGQVAACCLKALLWPFLRAVARLDCDILLAVHPNYFGIKDKLKQLEENPTHNPFIDNQACKQYAADANKKLNARIYEELQAEHEG